MFDSASILRRVPGFSAPSEPVITKVAGFGWDFI
jgi:hypothetical protein